MSILLEHYHSWSYRLKGTGAKQYISMNAHKERLAENNTFVTLLKLDDTSFQFKYMFYYLH